MSQAWPAPVVRAAPQPGDFCCIPVTGWFGTAIEAGQYLAEKLQGIPAGLRPYDHAEVYVGQADTAGPYGYTCSAYPDATQPGKSGRRALPCPPAQLPGSIWSSGIIPLTDVQRHGIISWCMGHPRVSYSWPDYGAIALRALRIPAPGLREYIKSTKAMMCSYYTDSAFNYGGGVHLFQDGRWEGYVTPGDLAMLLLGKAGLPYER
jgi:hypothetical protein